MSLAGLATNFVWPLREYFEYEPNSDETWVRPRSEYASDLVPIRGSTTPSADAPPKGLTRANARPTERVRARQLSSPRRTRTKSESVVPTDPGKTRTKTKRRSPRRA